MEESSIELRLFDPDRQQRRELWKFVKLVAPTIEKRKWKTREAISAYCLKCKKELNYTPGTSKQVLRHMQKLHEEDLNENTIDGKRNLQQPTIHQAAKRMKPVNDSIAQKGHALLLKWITQSYRPLSIVEDPGLSEFSKFVNGLEQKYTLPSRSTITRLLKVKYNDLQLAIKTLLHKECDYYSVTSDIWTSRSTNAYISIMLHYVSEAFDIKTVTLRCAPFSTERHTGEAIAHMIRTSLEEAGLSEEKLVVYVTDNASNAVKSGRDLGVNHFGCIAHTLNLIVQKCIRYKCGNGDQSSGDNSSKYLMKTSNAINTLRDYVKFFSCSTAGAQWLKTSMEGSNVPPKKIPLDVATRWNSTVHMLKVGIDVRLHLDAFCLYVNSSEGRKHFPTCSKISEITREEWFILENICIVLSKFDEATEVLSGENYPIWSLTLPILRMIKLHLIDYKVTDGFKQASWYAEAVLTIEKFRIEILNEFKERFKAIQLSLFWTILLDPRLVAMNGFSDDERSDAKAGLLRQMKFAPCDIQSFRQHGTQIIDSTIPTSNNSLLRSIFASTTNQLLSENDESNKCEDELNLYLRQCEKSTIACGPNTWWSANGSAFPTLAWLSRKWMSAVSTSVSSERLFSRTGSTVTSRRSKLTEDHVEMLTFVHDNLKFI